VTARAATAADLAAFYGAPIPHTVQAMVVEADGTPLAIIGLVRSHGQLTLFSDYRPEFRPYMRKIATMRALKRVTGWMQERARVVFAISDRNEPESPALLERLGFEHIDSGPTGDIYQWQA
jgi:hypothetical protein